jgi:HEAT repeat protein
MNIKDLPHVTVEQVLALRKAAIELEQELSDLKASLPKIKADSVREYGKKCDSVFYTAYKPTPEDYANKLEAGE